MSHFDPPPHQPQGATVPRRHGANVEESRRVVKPFLWFISDRKKADPRQAQWQRMGQALLEGDPPADVLVDWMFSEGMAQTRAQFEIALEKGIEALPSAPSPLKDFFAHIDHAPIWLDAIKMERGALVSHLSGLTGFRVLRDLGLMAGYQAGAINKTLVMTGALEKGASKRIAETTKWFLDCVAPHGMARFNDGFKNTVRVRLIHAMVRRRVSQNPAWHSEEWGLPINQIDMQATYLGFSAVYLLGQRILGVIVTPQEADDLMHLWRYIGWLMGVQEQWLCETEAQARIALCQNLLSQAPADDSSTQLARALMDEPLSRTYKSWQWLQRRWNKQVHLSICRLFLGKQGMRNLGLPSGVMPWYPLLFAPINWLWCAAHRLMPNGRDRLIRRGRRAQVSELAVLFGHSRPGIARMDRVNSR